MRRNNLSKLDLSRRFNNPVMKNQSMGDLFRVDENNELELIGDLIGRASS